MCCLAMLASPIAEAQRPLEPVEIDSLRRSYQGKVSGEIDRKYGGRCDSGDYVIDSMNPYGYRRDCFEERYHCEAKYGDYSYAELEDPHGEFQKCVATLWQYVRDERWSDIPHLKFGTAKPAEPGTPARPAETQRNWTTPVYPEDDLPDIGDYDVPEYAKDPDPYQYARTQADATSEETSATSGPMLDHGDGADFDIDDLGNTDVLDVVSPPPKPPQPQRQATKYCLCQGGDIETLGQCNDPINRGVYSTGYYPWTPDCKHPVAR